MANLLINTTVGGNAVITTSNIGSYALTSITSGNVTTALGYTPYNATNPSGYITSSGSISGNAGSVTNGVYTTGTQTIGGLKTFSSNIENSATADWYMYGFGARGASAGQYGIGLKADIADRTLSFHVPNHVAYSSTGAVPKFGWYSNGSVELMTLTSASGNLTVTGTTSATRFNLTGTGAFMEGYGTYSSKLGRVAIISLDWNANYDQPFNHGITSTDSAGNFADSLSINSFNDITLRLDSNNNNAESYLRIMNNTETSNTIAYIGYDGGSSVAWFGGVVTAVNDFRAPIFYDSANTGYYGDFASTSNLYKLQLGGGSEILGLLGMGSSYWYGMGITNAYTTVYSHFQGNGVQLGSYNGTTFVPKLTVGNDGNVSTTGDINMTSNTGIQYSSTHWIRPRDSSGNLHIKADSGGIYLDTDVIHLRGLGGVNDTTVSGGNITTAGGYYTNAGLSTNGSNGALTVQSPGGASRGNASSSETGAFKIKLPAGLPVYGMFKLVIHIYEYGNRGNSYEIHCGGHMYPNYMYNRFQVQYGASNSPLTVRYGNDGSTGCIWIGNLDTTWSYPQIWVSEFMIGYSNTSWATWRSGWSITLDSASFGNSGAMDGPYTCEFGYAATANYAATSGSATTATTATTASNTNSISNALANTHTWTGAQNNFLGNGNTASTNNVGLVVYSNGGSSVGAQMSFHRSGQYAINMGLDSDNVFRIGGWSAGANRLQLDMSGNLTVAGALAGSNFSGTSSGTNTGDQTNISGNAATATALTSMNISQFTNNSGYLTSVPAQSQLISPNGATVVAADSAMPNAGHSFIHSLALGPGGNDGHILAMTWASTTTSYGAQIFLDTDPNDIMAIRSRSNAGVWTSWKTIYHNGNFTDNSSNWNTAYGWGNHASAGYLTSVTNISGNAATATTATYASYLNALSNYSWTSSSLPNTYHLGITSAFVGPTEGWQNYGSVMTMRTYSGGGGSLQLYTPYGPGNGGDSLQVRFGNYNVSTGNSWTGWKTLIDSGNISSQSVSYATTAGSLTSMNISQFTNNSGYITGISFANVSSKPTTISGYGITDAITTANIGSQSVSYAATAGSAPNAGNINQFYNVTAGLGNGLRFWGAADYYKISMGVGALYQYGPVTDYSIKTQMNDGDTGRGFTWGRESYAPIAALNSTSGDMEVAGYYKSYGYRGNGNVGGTGSASWHPDGIYCGSTMWQYGAQYKNNTGMYGVSEMTMNSGPTLSTYNTRNLIVRALDNNADVGILGQKSGGGFAFQIYGTGSSYGFLNGTWASWDIRKAVSGAMYMNDNDSYYLQTNSTSNFYALNIQGNAVVHAGNIGSQSVSYATTAGTANAVAWTNVSSRPTALSQFTNDLGNYGGFLTSITAHTHAISDVTGLQTALDSKQASGSYAASSHTHDDRYYTESESDTRFARRDADSAISGNLVIGNGTYGNSTAYGSSGARLMFSGSDTDAQGNYYIGTNHNDYGGNYSKLELRWHTGIRMGAQPGYGGIRFYDTEDLGTVIFSVGTGDSHVRVVNNLYVGGNLALHAGNYNSYSPTLTGTGASGTWGISISGNAATATNVAWTGVTSRPTALSQFTNDLGNYGGWITGINSGNVTTALGFTPYNATNPSGYITSSASISGNAATATYATTAGSAPANGGNSATVGGYTPSGSVGANTVVIRDANNYIYAHYINSNVSETENPTINSFYTSNGDGWLRKSSVAHVKSQLGLGSMAYESSGTYQTVSGAINTGNIASQSVSYATISQQLTKFGDIYGQDWNGYFITGKLIVSNALGHTGANRPSDSYGYGTTLSYGETGGPLMQMYFPEDVGNTGGAYRALAYRSGYNGGWSPWKTVVNQVGNTCTVAGSNGTGLQVHSNVGYNQNPLTYFLLRGQADSSWKTFKILLTGDAGGQDIEFRRIAENSTDARIFYVPRGLNQVIFDYTVVQPSDSRLKDNLTPITNPVDKIKSLRGVEFDWNSGEHVGTHDVGLIAQDVEAVLPEAVTTQEDGYKNLAYTKVIPLLVEAMKEQQTMIEALRAEIELLKNK